VVRGADLKQLLDVGDLPPGNIVLDLDLVPLTAMAQFGMAAGRQGVADEVEAEESEQISREAALGMYDFYVGLVSDMLLNARRFRLSIEIDSDYMKIHKWLLPRADSTLSRLLASQKSGFPDFARRMNAESAVTVMVSAVDLSDEVRGALKEYAASYTELMGALTESMPDEEQERFQALMDPWLTTADRWIDCTRGDMAATYEFAADTGFRMTQIGGMTDGKKCGALMDEVATMMAEMPALSDGNPLAVVEKQALVHAGVQATRFEFDMFGDVPEEGMELMQQMVGEEWYVTYVGLKEDLVIAAAGAGAEQAFKDAVDAMSSKKKRGGITSKQFEPMKADAGIFFMVDAAKMLHEVSKLDPDDEDLGELDALADQAGLWLVGTHLDPDALRIEFDMPLSALEIFAALGDDDDHDDDDDQDHDHETEDEDGHGHGHEGEHRGE